MMVNAGPGDVPAAVVAAAGEALIEKSVMPAADCVTELCTGPPFALTDPETVICGLTTGRVGVTSTSTTPNPVVEEVCTARELIVHVMVLATTVPQEPEPLVTLAAWVVTPAAGTFAIKITFVAGSGAVFAMSKVNATGVPADTGLGEGLLLAAVSFKTLLEPSFATNASGAVPLSDV